MVRETIIDLYLSLEKEGYEPDDIFPFVAAPQPSLCEVFELSLFLYGYYKEEHIGIRPDDTSLNNDWSKNQTELKADTIKFSQIKAYPLFLSAAGLNNQEIIFNDNMYILSFSHKPTRANYWHLEL